MELLQIVEIICLVTTLGFFAVGLHPCLEMYKTGNTKDVPYVMFLLSVLSCSTFTHYAYLLDITSLVFLNVVGTALNVLYVYMYLAVVRQKATSIAYLSAAVAYLAVLYSYLYQVVQDEETRISILGSSSSAITTFLFTFLPGVELIDNIRHKNADGMPFVMLVGGFVCGVAWLVYGILLEDPNVYVPNLPGLTITIAKLAVVQMYGGGKAKSE